MRKTSHFTPRNPSGRNVVRETPRKRQAAIQSLTHMATGERPRQPPLAENPIDLSGDIR